MRTFYVLLHKMEKYILLIIICHKENHFFTKKFVFVQMTFFLIAN